MNPFDSVIGHRQPIEILSRQLQHDRVHHAYLFAGPRQVGKTALAEAFAASLLDIPVADLDRHPDVIRVQRTINPKTKKLREQIAVEQVQEARERFEHSSMSGGYKVLIIEGAEQLSITAANALLKTLEEPRGKAVMILTTTSLEMMLPTIRSRSQQIRLHPVGDEALRSALADRGAGDVDRLTMLSAGCPGVALRVLEDEEATEALKLREEAVRALLVDSKAEQLLALKGLLPAYDADHVKTRTELFERLNIFEILLRKEVINGTRDPDVLRNLVSVRRDLKRHLNPKLTLINMLSTV